jgi:hypothetical protein
MYYIISHKYVGPNNKDSKGNIIGDSETRVITTSPPLTNQSHEKKVSGWLGTTNDIASYAHGEFSTVELALQALKDDGFTSPVESDEEDAISEWQTESASRDNWDVKDWLDSMTTEQIASEYGITANSSNDELEISSEKIEKEAENENINIYGAFDYFSEIRDELGE